MEIGVGLDASLGLSWDDQRTLAREAAELGYECMWTPSSGGFQMCAQWHGASGLATGVSVMAAPLWTPVAMATEAAQLGSLTGGSFTLGIASGTMHNAGYRNSYGLPDVGVIRYMRGYLQIVRALLAGETVTHEDPPGPLRGVSLGARTPRVPVILGAMGAQMLRLAGEASDGAGLNWCNTERVAWSREQMNAGAKRAGRDPAEVKLVEYIRICVDEDEDRARRGFARSVMGYAMARPGAAKDKHYRGHFARMGFDAHLNQLEAMRDAGASNDELVDAFPVEVMRAVGYFGKPAGAAAAFQRLAEGLDTAIVRVVSSRPGIDGVRLTMRAALGK